MQKMSGGDITTESALRDRLGELELALMVLDATIYCLDYCSKDSPSRPLFDGQVKAAKDTYERATGEPSMIGFKREQSNG